MAKDTLSRSLRALASLYGVQTSYQDIFHKRRDVSRDGLIAVLRALGAPLEKDADAGDALRERRRALWRRVLPPTIAFHVPGPAPVTIRLPQQAADGPLRLRLALESGQTREWTVGATSIVSTAIAREIDGQRSVALRLSLPPDMPLGYHRLQVDAGSARGEALVIAAPQTAFLPSGTDGDSLWGVFAPLYALHSSRSWGAGDLSDLESVAEWVAGLGGNVVATLPLLPAFLRGVPFEYSPYSPVSRLFWNEFYVDPQRAPEWTLSTAAQVEWATPETQREIAALRALPEVDYRRQMEVKRRVLEGMARSFFARGGVGQGKTGAEQGDLPAIEDYARFRAATERRSASWWAWPERQRNGDLRSEDYDTEVFQYHLYAQLLVQDQMRAVKDSASRRGQRVYLDLPVGAHPDGYDVWRQRDSFALGMSVGAPPDDFFTLGQDWGFLPLHPEQERAREYRYLIASLRHHLKTAGVLRIDHVMQLHRLFWVPNGFSPKDGVYVRYPAKDLYAILTLESQRQRSVIIGENLGTVPPYVNETLARRRVHGLFISQFATHPDRKDALPAVAPDISASLNTHDTPTFAAFWDGSDIDTRVAMGWMTPEQAVEERKGRAWLRERMSAYFGSQTELSARDALKGYLAHLASSDARLVLVSLEDMWQEDRPQNLPGTGMEQPNWRRKARLSIQQFSQDAGVVSTLVKVNVLRKERAREHGRQA